MTQRIFRQTGSGLNGSKARSFEAVQKAASGTPDHIFEGNVKTDEEILSNEAYLRNKGALIVARLSNREQIEASELIHLQQGQIFREVSVEIGCMTLRLVEIIDIQVDQIKSGGNR